MPSAMSLASLTVVLLLPGLGAAQDASAVATLNNGWDDRPPHNVAPVVLSDNVREKLPNDYLRITFVPAGVIVTTLSRPGSVRAFATATPLYSPPLKLADFPTYSGLIDNEANVLVAMRCHPRNPDSVDAVLATWPNVFSAIQRDIQLNPDDCNGQPSDPATQVACFARNFSDPPSAVVPTALSRTFSYAATLFDDGHTALAQWLQSNYGIFPAFAGTGYSVKDSYSITSDPMTSQQILVKSVSSEYVLKNVTLSDAGCSCISVAPYRNRSRDRLDPDFISLTGGHGACTAVDRLEVVHNER